MKHINLINMSENVIWRQTLKSDLKPDVVVAESHPNTYSKLQLIGQGLCIILYLEFVQRAKTKTN